MAVTAAATMIMKPRTLRIRVADIPAISSAEPGEEPDAGEGGPAPVDPANTWCPAGH